MQDLAKQGVDWLRAVGAIGDLMHRNVMLHEMIADARVAVTGESEGLGTLEELARMSERQIFDLARHGESRANVNAALQGLENYAHQLVEDLDYRDGEAKSET